MEYIYVISGKTACLHRSLSLVLRLVKHCIYSEINVRTSYT